MRLLIYILIVNGVIAVSMIAATMSYLIAVYSGYNDYWFAIYNLLFLILTISTGKIKLKIFTKNLFSQKVMLIHPIALVLLDLIMLLLLPLWAKIFFALLLLPIANGHLSSAYYLSNKIIPTGEKSYARIATSIGWLIGPALSFFIIDNLGYDFLPRIDLFIAIIWLVVSFVILSRNHDVGSIQEEAAGAFTLKEKDESAINNFYMVVILISATNALAKQAMPLIIIKHYQLQTYFPGLVFAIKCFSEIISAYVMEAYLANITSLKTLILCICLGIIAHVSYYLSENSLSFEVSAFLEGMHYGLFSQISMRLMPGRTQKESVNYINSLMIGGIISTVSLLIITVSVSITTVFIINSICLLSILFFFIYLLLSRGKYVLTGR
ncbi:MFS transporter [Pantoea agglomerans]|uniref:MFS transporter n=1 Tax=Enterobacter agglomerans TaxID=549 RepID=UPI003C799600